VRHRAVGAALGLAADQIWAEPPIRPHPVAVFGSLMGRAEARLYRNTRGAGIAHAALGLLVGLGAGTIIRGTAPATYLAVAQKELGRVALGIAGALGRQDLEQARLLLPSLVGRDPWDLDGAEIARAVVESVAENTVDAVVAPACWAAVAGARGALGYRAVNTMDASVGHRSVRYLHYGWASARLDDVANLVPARLTALLVGLVRPGSAGAVWRTVRRDAAGHPSPNAGVAEAAFAAALGIQLGGTNHYDYGAEPRPLLGAGRRALPEDIARAVRLSRDVTWALAAALAVVGILG
jgi:adenosylcobinamide-phosphate synthase